MTISNKGRPFDIRQYESKKFDIFKEAKKFNDTDDLTHLANLVIIANKILKNNRFPIREYTQWIKNQA